jgi:hypothetical protein
MRRRNAFVVTSSPLAQEECIVIQDSSSSSSEIEEQARSPKKQCLGQEFRDMVPVTPGTGATTTGIHDKQETGQKTVRKRRCL